MILFRNFSLVRGSFTAFRHAKRRFLSVERQTLQSSFLHSSALVRGCSKSSSFGWLLLPTLVAAAANSDNESYSTYCSPETITTTTASDHGQPSCFFPNDWLVTDHYNGVTLHLTDENVLDTTTFQNMLQQSLQHWYQDGRKGIWLHLSHGHADKIPIAVSQQFSFHMVSPVTGSLILSKWLPTHLPNKLPAGPSHQVGVGCLVLHPNDPTHMLVVQEQTGPAAAYGLWKMPTGLADRGEDIHQAAVRELKEETGLDAAFEHIWQFRQAHGAGGGGRSHSDLFFVCQLSIPDNVEYKACPEEIAAIQWMSVEDYCGQVRWKDSPVYHELNRIVLQASMQQQQQQPVGAIRHYTLPLGFGKGTNTLYHGVRSDGSTDIAKSQL